jgi:hypothetical protein
MDRDYWYQIEEASTLLPSQLGHEELDDWVILLTGAIESGDWKNVVTFCDNMAFKLQRMRSAYDTNVGKAKDVAQALIDAGFNINDVMRLFVAGYLSDDYHDME